MDNCTYYKKLTIKKGSLASMKCKLNKGVALILASAISMVAVAACVPGNLGYPGESIGQTPIQFNYNLENDK